MNGYDNEFNFVKAINRRKVRELNPLLFDLVTSIFPAFDYNSEIKCWRNHYKQKSDILIKIGNVIKRVSIKMGMNNSVHCEPVSTFTWFLHLNGVSDDIINEILLYHYADGTINGTGNTRISASEYKEKNLDKIRLINNALNNDILIHKMVDRFITKGLVFNDHVDAIVYGVPNDFVFIKYKDIYNVIKSKKDIVSNGIHVGPLYMQSLNRCLNRNPKYEEQRHFVQIKWYSIFDDIIEYLNRKVVSNVDCSFQADNVAP